LTTAAKVKFLIQPKMTQPEMTVSRTMASWMRSHRCGPGRRLTAVDTTATYQQTSARESLRGGGGQVGSWCRGDQHPRDIKAITPPGQVVEIFRSVPKFSL
jgi:hypothetical protein